METNNNLDVSDQVDFAEQKLRTTSITEVKEEITKDHVSLTDEYPTTGEINIDDVIAQVSFILRAK